MAPPTALHAAPCHIHPPSPSATGCRLCQELSVLRMYRCARCGCVALVCSGCDRGQIYCAAGCAKLARRESQRRVGARHQRTPEGRRNHAARQQRYRLRLLQKVTHQGPPAGADPVDPGLADVFAKPAQEESDVPTRAVRSLPRVSHSFLPPPAAPEPLAASSRLAGLAASLRCHFCQRAQSVYLRRESLCALRRRPRHRPS